MFNFVKTPITVIGAFIFLIYGCVNWLLGSTATHLDRSQIWVLLGFIVSLPFVVLFVFYWLLTRHHEKLYAPSDFRSDKSFFNFVRHAKPAEIDNRLVEDAEAWVNEETVTEIMKQPPSAETIAPLTQIKNRIAKANDGAIKYFEREFGVHADRNVEIGDTGAHYDALLFDAVEPILIEVKVLLSDDLKRAEGQMRVTLDMNTRARDYFHGKVRIIVVFVCCFSMSKLSPLEKRLRDQLSTSRQKIELRFIEEAELIDA
jgi:hypothetical protein